MHEGCFLPEGELIHTEQNKELTKNAEALTDAMENEQIIEGKAIMCDEAHNLIVDINGHLGIIPHAETAIGIEDGTTREIAVISRVGKPVSCILRGFDSTAKEPLLLSRRAAQEAALKSLFTERSPGDVIPAVITHLEPFGAFVDIGCGNISLLGIETLSVSRISHPSDRFSLADRIFAVISGFDYEKNRVFLTHKELLGTWAENTSSFKIGQTVRGIVRGVEEYGIFVELTPNLSGLAEFRDGIKVGDCVSVFIKSILPEKMKVKLIIIDVFDDPFFFKISPENYFIDKGHIDSWKYSPGECTKKLIYSEF